MLQHRPIMLMILDGWGYSEEETGNAIAAAKTPNFDKLWEQCPHALLKASGLAVGLPEGQMGNSEVGHLHIGAGRLAPQDLTRVNLAVKSGEFFLNNVLTATVDQVKDSGNALHIFGLLSPGGIHSHTRQIQAMAELAAQRGLKNIYLHAFLDGRDTPPKSAEIYLQAMEATFQKIGCGKIASITGRFYAMDRDKRWERVQAAYEMLTEGKSELTAPTAQQALEESYSHDKTDEFVKPTCIHGPDEAPVTVGDGDAIVFMNFRADRGRELSYAFTDDNFDGFSRQARPKLAAYVTLTQYAADLKTQVAFPPQELHNVIGQVVADHGLTQLRIAETEKYAHVTFFINGGEEMQFKNEDRILVPSPKVETYDEQPEMNAPALTEKLTAAIKSKKYDFIICNFANPDMLGHTGIFDKTVSAIETIDKSLGEVLAALRSVEGEMVIIADHGNAEKMTNAETGQPHTAHTISPVPFIYVGRDAEIINNEGALTDIAPTLLMLLNIAPPQEMTGKTLLKLHEENK